MSATEQELKRLLHYGYQFLFYQPGDRAFNDCYHSFMRSTMSQLLLAGEEGADPASCIVKAYSDGYSAHPAMLVYALAICIRQQSHQKLREAAYKALKTVCSSTENFFLFIKYSIKLSETNSMWGSGFRKFCKDWYLKKDVKTLAEIVGRQKKWHGWSHKDIIKLIHLKTEEPARAAIVKYILFGIKAAKKEYGENAEANEVLNYLQAVNDFKHLTDEQQAARNIEIHHFTLDHVPPHLMKFQEVWASLVGNLPLATLLKSLEKMGYLGFLKPNSLLVNKVVEALNDENAIAESHLQPAQVYIALRNYEMSSKFIAAENARKKRRVENGEAKKMTKAPPKPSPKILSALHDLFASTCKLFLAPTGLRYFVAIDLKSFASNDSCERCPHVSPAQAAVVTTLCLLHADRNVTVQVVGANDELVPVALTTSMTVQQGVKKLEESGMRHLKLSTPLEWALKKKDERDVFVLITDSQPKENNAVEALEKYREEMKIPNVKLVTVLLKSSFEPFWVKESGFFTVGGFDGNVPRLIEAFSRGAF